MQSLGDSNGDTAAGSPSPPTPMMLLLLLDIDGVINRLSDDSDDDGSSSHTKVKRPKKNKRNKESAPFVSPLACVPNLVQVQSALDEARLAASSVQPSLLRHLAHLIHAAAGCGCGEDGGGDNGTPVRLVLSSTWRLQKESRECLRRVFAQLGLASAELADAADAAAAATHAPTIDQCTHKRCRLQVQPLECTPDLQGWGTRLDEILAYLQTQLHQQPAQAAAEAEVNGSPASEQVAPKHSLPFPFRFLILDDMDLYASLRLSHPSRGGALAEVASLCQERTPRIRGSRGLDGRAMGRACAALQGEAAKTLPPVFAEFLAGFVPPRLPSPSEEENEEDQR